MYCVLLEQSPSVPRGGRGGTKATKETMGTPSSCVPLSYRSTKTKVNKQRNEKLMAFLLQCSELGLVTVPSLGLLLFRAWACYCSELGLVTVPSLGLLLFRAWACYCSELGLVTVASTKRIEY